jgi:hypothetical protein
LRKLIFSALGVSLLGVIAVILVGGQLTAPRQQLVGEPPADFQAESKLISRVSAAPISGWFVAGHSQKAGILLLHSIRSNRREMIGRAKFLHEGSRLLRVANRYAGPW